METHEVFNKLLQVIRKPTKIPFYINRSLFSMRSINIYWPQPGYASLGNNYYFKPKGTEVLVLNHSTLVSPGTERAYFSGLPNTNIEYPYIPGYSGAGEVLMVGPDVARFRPGDRVSTKSSHSNMFMAQENDVFPIPAGVTFDQAAFIQLAIIVLQGVRKGNVKIGEKVLILGQGLIGQLTNQLVVAQGAFPVIAVANSFRQKDISLASGVHHFISLRDNPGDLKNVSADLVIETSGHPTAIQHAINHCHCGGRIVLLGSPRGDTNNVDFRKVQEKNLSLIGSHVSTLPVHDSIDHSWTAGREAETFWGLIRQKILKLDLLITNYLSPDDALWFYQHLSKQDKPVLGAIFCWDEFSNSLRRTPSDLLFSFSKPSKPKIREIRDKMGKTDTLLSKSKFGNYFLPEGYDKETKEENNFEPLKIGMIGCGEIAVLNAEAVQLSKNAKIAMTMDLNEKLAKDLADRYKTPYAIQIEKLLENKEVEAVIISVPHYLHLPLALKALSCGKHVIVEKPLSLTASESDEIISMSQKTGMKLSVFYCGRYLPYIQKAKNWILKGGLGELLGLSINFQTDKPDSYWYRGYSGRVETDWRASKEKSGGGLLIFNMVHYLDMIRYLTEAEVNEVKSDYAILDTRVEVEDTISAIMRYDNGAIGMLQGASCVRGASGMLDIRIWGTDGSLIIRNHMLTKTPLEFYSTRKIDDYIPGKWFSYKNIPSVNERSILINHFAKAVRKGLEPEVTGRDSRAIQVLVDAIYTSGEQNKPVIIGNCTGS